MKPLWKVINIYMCAFTYIFNQIHIHIYYTYTCTYETDLFVSMQCTECESGSKQARVNGESDRDPLCKVARCVAFC